MPIPKLASDARRITIAGLFAYVPASLDGFGRLIPGVNDALPFGSGPVGLGSWCLFGIFYLVLTVRTFGHVDAETLARWLRDSTPRTRSSRFMLWLSGGSGTSWAAQVAVVAVLIVLSLSFTAQTRSSLPFMIAGVSAVAGSWLLILSSFTIEYARKDANAKGFVFPGDDTPSFNDYFYAAVQVSTSFSVADVVVTTPELRRTVTWHSLIAFAFNTVIIAILISALLAVAS